MPRSARRIGTVETTKTHVVVLITQRRVGQPGNRVNALAQIEPDYHASIAVAEKMATASATRILSKWRMHGGPTRC
jgi:hypothetical protein